MAEQEASVLIDKYLDSLNEAMAIHARNAIENLPFNKTELVEIVDITNRNEGSYIVWNGSTRYVAYSENTSYQMGNKVYVTIPNNDFTGRKLIIGQYKQDGEEGVWYRSPLKNYEPVTQNIITDKDLEPIVDIIDENGNGLIANWDKAQTTLSANAMPQSITLFKATGLENNTTYQARKYLGISADFKTLLNTFNPIGGDYGIKVLIEYVNKLQVGEVDSDLKLKVFNLSTADMVGSIYNFTTYYHQEALFNIENLQIHSIAVIFYQDGGFKDNENQTIPHTYTMGGNEVLYDDNILVKNIDIRLGDDISNNRDTLKIYTLNGTSYDSAQKDALNSKNIYLQWTHKNSTDDEIEDINSTTAVSKNDDLKNVKIHWYRDTLYSMGEYFDIVQEEVSDWQNKLQLITNWKQAEADGDAEEKARYRALVQATFNLNPVTDYNVDTGELTSTGSNKINLASRSAASATSVVSDTLAGDFWKPISTATAQMFQIQNFIPDMDRQACKVKSIIEYGPLNADGSYDTGSEDYAMIESNELEFRNLRAVPDRATSDKLAGLRIVVEDQSNGRYPIYNGTTGELLSRLEVKDRTLRVEYNSTTTGVSYLNGNETIIWQLPKTRSMIQINETFYTDATELTRSDSVFTTYNQVIGEYNGDYRYIKREAVNHQGQVDAAGAAIATQKYRIAQFFNKANTNNTIFCYIIKNNEMVKTSITMEFSQHGTSGTDYTFALGLGELVDADWNVMGPADTALTLGEQYYHRITFDLFNSKNEQIDLTDAQKNAIIKPWVNGEDKGYYLKRNWDKLEFITKSTRGNYTDVAVKAKSGTMEDLRNIVLQAYATTDVEDHNLGNVTFVQLLPIHVRANNSDWVMNGSDYIVYDDKGANPTCYNDAYSVRSDNLNVSFSNVSIIRDDDIAASADSYYPKIDTRTSKLVPTPLYIDSITKYLSLEFRDSGRNIIYVCPLVILQNKYQIPAINNWNGQLVVDAEGNKVLASMVGAGHKNSDNTFSGVLMGDVVQKDPYTALDTEMTGLFGYDKGAQTFGFNTDGTAFIGKSDIGRIYVNGNTGRITSAAREAYEINKARNVTDTDPRGTDINLKDNYIDIQGVGNKSRVHLDTIERTGEYGTGAYFSIDDDDGQRLLHVGDGEYYLQTDSYAKGNPGLKIDLKNGVLDSTAKFTLNGGDGSSINLGNNSSFNSTGTLTINGATGSSINFGSGSNSISLGLNDDGSYLTSTGTLNITGDKDSNITFGKTFKVDGNGELTLGSLTFVDTNGNIQTNGSGGPPATGIHPKWMTFITDISGKITKGRASVSVPVTNTAYVPYSYTDHYSTTADVYAHGLFLSDGKINGQLNGEYSHLTITSSISDFSSEGTRDSSALSVTVSGTTYADLDIPVTRYGTVAYTDTWTGTTDYEVVQSITLTVKKVSMWALTNNNIVETTVTILDK